MSALKGHGFLGAAASRRGATLMRTQVTATSALTLPAMLS